MEFHKHDVATLREEMKEAATIHSPRSWFIQNIRWEDNGVAPVVVFDVASWLPGIEAGPVECAECGDLFAADSKKAKFCSPACRQKDYRKRKGGLGKGLAEILRPTPDQVEAFCAPVAPFYDLAYQPTPVDMPWDGGSVLRGPIDYASNEPNWRADDVADSYEEDL